MSLAPDLARVGLWRDPAAKAGDAGVHALIVGVSAYNYLPGGSPRPGNRTPLPPVEAIPGMGQLVVSASGAAQVFNWLKRNGRFAGRPVLSARLLLAPGPSTPSAQGLDPVSEDAFVQTITDGHHAEPTFTNISAMVQEWADEFYAAPPAVRSRSAALFFFSGHGLEVLASPSLLASDILNPLSGAGRNNAVAYRSITDALPTYGLGDGIFLFDCCRNAPDVAKKLNIQGQPVLQPAAAAADAPDCMMWLKAAEQNMRSYQDPNSPRRASLFTQAILEGLEGFPPGYQPYDQAQTPWRLEFDELESFAKDRVRTLLQDQNSLKVQVIVAGGEPYVGETMVAERDPPPPPPTTLVAPPDIPRTAVSRSPGISSDFALSVDLPEIEEDDASPPEAGDDGGGFSGSAQSAPDAPEADRSGDVLARFTHQARVAPSADRGLSDWTTMHEVLGHEMLTDGWVRTIVLQDLLGRPLPSGLVRVVAGRSADRAGLAWIDIEVEPGLGEVVFVSLNRGGATSGVSMPASLGVLIPRDQSFPVPVRLECTFSGDPREGILTPIGLSGRLAPPQERGAATSIWGDLFASQRESALYSLARGAALIPAEQGSLVDAVRRKRTSPVAAAIGAASLLQLGAIDRVRDWPRNLAQWFEPLPDGAVLWAETLLRRWRAAPAPAAARAGLAESARAFTEVNRRGAPFLGGVLAMAVGQAQFWTTRTDLRPAEIADDLDAACERVLAAAADVDPDSLFLAFRSEATSISAPTAFRRAAGLSR